MVQALVWQPYRQVDGEYTEFIGASLSEPHMGSKSVPRELSI